MYEYSFYKDFFKPREKSPRSLWCVRGSFENSSRVSFYSKRRFNFKSSRVENDVENVIENYVLQNTLIFHLFLSCRQIAIPHFNSDVQHWDLISYFSTFSVSPQIVGLLKMVFGLCRWLEVIKYEMIKRSFRHWKERKDCREENICYYGDCNPRLVRIACGFKFFPECCTSCTAERP